MFRKQNKLEILELLRKESIHLREIAKRMNVVPSTTMRLLKELQQENILDYKQEGKNKRYFLKDTPEAKIQLFILEHYKTIQLLQNPTIRKIYKEIIPMTKGELIVLFGSYAKKMYTPSSDIDLYIETNNKELKAKVQQISNKLSIHIGKLNKKSLLAKEIIKDHILLQSIEKFYQIQNEKE